MSDSEPPEDVSKKDLWKEVQKLKEHVYPNRREVLKGGLAAAAGAAIGVGATGNAAAGSQSAGTWGTQSKPQDGYVEDLYDHNGNNVLTAPGDGSVSIGDLSVTNTSDLQQKILSSWGDVYPATDAGMDQAITDLNAASPGAVLITPNGTFTVDTTWVATSRKTIRSQSGMKNGTKIQASANVSGQLVEIQGSHRTIGVGWFGQGNVPATMEVTASSVSNVHHKNLRVENGGTTYSLDMGTGSDSRDNFNWTLINCEYTDTSRWTQSYWVHSYDCLYNSPDGAAYALHTDRVQMCSIRGGSIAGRATDTLLDAGDFLDVLVVDGVAFESATGSDGADPTYMVDWGAAGGAPTKGGGVLNCRFLGGGGETATVVRQTAGSRFVGNQYNGIDTCVEVKTANTNFTNGVFGPIRADNVTTAVYSGFATNPSETDVRLHGGSFTTS